ncbi:NADPH-dependent FMN reductase [Aurantivibrio plasticivorans]
MKILAFAASNSKQSINKQLLQYATTLLSDVEIELLDINDYAMPIYGEDLEAECGIPAAAQQFLDKIASADALIISYAEHNGGYAVAYKNLFDWTTRINQKVYQGKPIVMLSTSPGGAGASNVLNMAVTSAEYFDGRVVSHFSLPSFYDNFDQEQGLITNLPLRQQYETALARVTETSNMAKSA